jgi:hypothetical protein
MRYAAAAVACCALAAALTLVAADVARWPEALRAGDVRYRVAPTENGLWRARQRVPGGLARRILGVGDDLEVREALRAFRLGELDDLTISDPKLAVLRGEARARLETIALGDGEPAIRSRALGLLGALSLSSALNEPNDRPAQLRAAVRSFHDAIEADPDNAEAKLNLELALQRGRGLDVGEGSGGPNPSPGGAGAKGAGAGTPGSGY